LEARGEAHGVAMGHEVTKLLAPDVADERHTARDPDAEARERRILADDGPDRFLHRESRTGRRESVPWLFKWRVEDRDDGVARDWMIVPPFAKITGTTAPK